ncbi:MAG: M23 family metallopeptidase [Vicinamibacterales bacterium]
MIGTANGLARRLTLTALLFATAILGGLTHESWLPSTENGVEAHQISTPAPNGVSPWYYSESWVLTNWYGENLHCDWASFSAFRCTAAATGTHLNQYYALDFANGCNKRLWPIWNSMRVSRIAKSHPSARTNDLIEMKRVINGVTYRITYMHLNVIYARVGQIVGTTGNPIGLSGAQGLATGCHLHMVIHRYNPSNGQWYSVPPKFCGRTYPHSHVRFRGC